MRWFLSTLNPIARFAGFREGREDSDSATTVKELLRDVFLLGFLIAVLGLPLDLVIGDAAGSALAIGMAVTLMYLLRPWFERRLLS